MLQKTATMQIFAFLTQLKMQACFTSHLFTNRWDRDYVGTTNENQLLLLMYFLYVMIMAASVAEKLPKRSQRDFLPCGSNGYNS